MARKHRWVISLLVICLFIGSPGSRALADAAGDEQAVRDVVERYFSLRYQSLKAGTPLALADVVDAQDVETAPWLASEQEKRAIEQFILSSYGLKVVDYRFQVDMTTLEFAGNQAHVHLAEGNEITYAGRLGQPSRLANLRHAIQLKRSGAGWLVQRDQYSDDLRRAMDSASQERLMEIVQRNRGSGRGTLPGRTETPAPASVPAEGGQWRRYEAATAAGYADAHFDALAEGGAVPEAIQGLAGWNAAWPAAYKHYASQSESDCANLVSQALFEGAGYTASEANYFYPDPVHYADGWYYKFSEPVDGSLAWVQVGRLYAFLTQNDFNAQQWGLVSRGPVGSPVDACDLAVGDLVFLYQDGYGWRHVVMVDEVGTERCGGKQVYVAAHSEDQQHRPLAEYSEYWWYPVAVKGYLDFGSD